MSVSVSMPQLGESVTEGTVTRWLKAEGEHVEADEPLLEVSTDKVDTEIPSPVSGTLSGISVGEDETVEVGAELAVIDEDGAAGGSAAGQGGAVAARADADAAVAGPAGGRGGAGQGGAGQAAAEQAVPASAAASAGGAYGYDSGGSRAADVYQPPPGYQQPARPAAYQQPPAQQPPARPAGYQPGAGGQPEPPATGLDPGGYQQETGPAAGPAGLDGSANGTESPYVTPLVRKLAAEHGVDLATVTGTGVGGRIRKQDVLEAARAGRGPRTAASAAYSPRPAVPASPAAAGRPPLPSAAAQQPPVGTAPAAAAPAPFAAAAAQEPGPQAAGRRPIVPSRLRGTTERMSRARQVIAQRMVESLQTSAQLTSVVEVDVTAIARLRERAKAAFEAREGVKLSFLPFFALATVEALKAHPKLNAVIDTAAGQVTYHDDEHLGIAVDTDRGLMVPVIRNAGDFNIGGLARKIADLADRTRAGQVSPDDLSGGTFTLTNTGSRGALFDTPIINQPQVGILGTGTVVKRAVVMADRTLGEVITVRSMVYLALTYDHRLVDGADAVRFLVTVKSRLEEGAYETELGL